MTTMSSKFFQGHGASSSSTEADYLRLSVDSVRSLAQVVRKELLLNERQCQDLSSKLVLTVENIQKLVPSCGPLNVVFGPALKNLYRVLEKAKWLVHQCCDTDWCRAAVFQIYNEEAFREVLLEVGLCYNVVYELLNRTVHDWVWRLIQAQDLCHSSLFLPAPETDVRKDQETLEERLRLVAGTSDYRQVYLASHLLTKLECISAARTNEDMCVLDTLLNMNETEPEGTWELQRVIGMGAVGCVCCSKWLGIPCARKEFRGRVADVIFRREAAILVQLNHPNIVKFFSCSNGPEVGQCFIAMELMEMSLGSLIESRAKAKRSFPLLVVLDIMTQMARGVCYLHGLGIAHRDLKPQNVVVTESRAAHLEDCFCVKLVDFGMSKTKVQVFKSNTISIRGVGTTTYRAPEVFPQAQQVARGLKRKVNWFQADAYSFGITGAALLSLEEPFGDLLKGELWEKLLEGVRPELPGGCPGDLVALLKDCWATDPQCRPGFAEISSRLEQCKLHEILRVSSEGLQGVAGSEYSESVSMKHCAEQSPRSSGVPDIIDSDCTSTVSCHLDAAMEAPAFLLCDENSSLPSDAYFEDHQSIISPKLERKKKVGIWSRTMSSLARLMSTVVSLPKNVEEIESLQLRIQQKCEEFDVKSEVKPTLFPYNELKLATQDFHEDMEFVERDSGLMYKGVLPNGSLVVVRKVFFPEEMDEFLNKVVFSSEVKHKNLLNLEGCCLHGQQGLLVYEYAENPNVSRILLDEGPSRHLLSWRVRLKICLGVAQGSHYLHMRAHPRIIHRNITASNVFLDRNFNPKIGDSGLAVIHRDGQTSIRPDGRAGSRKYIAPEILRKGKWSDKADVFSFGVLGLEIISGRHIMEWYDILGERQHILEWARELHEKDRLLQLVDPTLRLTDVEVRDVQRVIRLCLWCVQYEAERRPSMARIVSILQGDTEWDGQVEPLGDQENGRSSFASAS